MNSWFEGKGIALVGNAESLFHKIYGDEIDRHDVIVRINKAAMLWTSLKADMSHGRRTDIWMVFNIGEYNHRAPTIRKGTNIKIMHMSHLRQTRLHKGSVDDMLNTEERKELCKMVGYNNPTTGLMGIHHIVNSKPRMLHVYGFDWKETPTFTDMERKKDPLCHHDYEAEKKLCFDHFFKMQNVEWKN